MPIFFNYPLFLLVNLKRFLIYVLEHKFDLLENCEILLQIAVSLSTIDSDVELLQKQIFDFPLLNI